MNKNKQYEAIVFSIQDLNIFIYIEINLYFIKNNYIINFIHEVFYERSLQKDRKIFKY